MADLLIKGISDISAPHDIHITNVGLNGVKEGFMAWDSAAGCVYEVVEVPTHGRLIDADKVPYFASEPWKAMATKSEIDKMPTVIEASEVEE